MKPISVLLVDDHALFREGLAGLLRCRPNIEVVGQAADGGQAVALARELMPDLILMDVRMAGMDGLDATRQIKAEMPDVRVVMLTLSENEADLFEAIKSGAQGYVLKDVLPEELYRFIEGIFVGEAPISGVMANKMLGEFAHPSPAQQLDESNQEQLSERELEVLHCLADGLTNRQIAEKLTISEHTVKRHLRNILAKLHLQNRVQAALCAYKQRGSKPRQ
ncbi:MAG: response regulator transcription factor [Chloroflexi bacterium]|nr:response regulator transcription factor [Chloroflexota bacterium]